MLTAFLRHGALTGLVLSAVACVDAPASDEDSQHSSDGVAARELALAPLAGDVFHHGGTGINVMISNDWCGDSDEWVYDNDWNCGRQYLLRHGQQSDSYYIDTNAFGVAGGCILWGEFTTAAGQIWPVTIDRQYTTTQWLRLEDDWDFHVTAGACYPF